VFFSGGDSIRKANSEELSEKSLKQGVRDLQGRLANNNNAGEVRESPTELLTKIADLEAMNKELEGRLESSRQMKSEWELESPEDVFRQRISELERLEKHLKHQVRESQS
jgi:hypothetical protein